MASLGWAQSGRGTVLLVTVPEEQGGWAEAELRASAELRTLGFRVVRASPTHIDRLAPVARQLDALALVRFTRPDQAGEQASPVAVYVVDRSTGRFDVRKVSPDRVSWLLTADEAGILAAELLYSALAAPTPLPKAPPPRPKRAAPPAGLALRVGGFLAGSPGGAGPFGGAALGGTWLPRPWIGVDLAVDLPVLASDVSDASSRATLTLLGERLHLRLPARLSSVTTLDMGLGGGLLHVWSRGVADPPLSGRLEAGTVGVVSAMTLLELRLGGRTRGVLGLRGALAIPEVTVTLAQKEAARFGRPLIDGSLAIEWTW